MKPIFSSIIRAYGDGTTASFTYVRSGTINGCIVDVLETIGADSRKINY